MTIRASYERLQSRRDWGFKAGVKSFKAGVPFNQNPFEKQKNMPMRSAWIDGWIYTQHQISQEIRT